MNKTSCRALIEHWDWAAEKGLMNRKTAQTLAGACRGILGVQDDWENLDVTVLNIEDSLTRFRNLRAKDFSPNSLRDYESRFRRAVESYREYLDDQATWKFPSRSAPTRRSSQPKHRKSPDSPSSAGSNRQGDAPDMVADPASGSQEYSYPIRPDKLAKLVIPRDATTAEINRLIAWAQTLAVDYEPTS